MGLPRIDVTRKIQFGRTWVRYQTTVEAPKSFFHSVCWLLMLEGFYVFDPDALKAMLEEYATERGWVAPADVDDYVVLIASLFPVQIYVHDGTGKPVPVPEEGRPHRINLFRNGGSISPVLRKGVRPMSPEAIIALHDPRLKPIDLSERDAPLQLRGNNTLRDVRCHCDVAPMSSDPIQIEVWDGTRGRTDRRELRFVACSAFTNPAAFRSVTLPKSASVADLCSEYVSAQGFHCDWYAGSSVKNGRLIASTDPQFLGLFRFEEQCYYAQRALLVGGTAGVTGKVRVLSLPAGASALMAKECDDVHGQPEKVTLQVHDGWGYIKECLAKELRQSNPSLGGVNEVASFGEAFEHPEDPESGLRTRVELRPPRAGYQMFQWFRAQDGGALELETKAVEELATRFETSAPRPVPNEIVREPWAKRLLAHARDGFVRHPLVRRVLRRSLIHEVDRRMLTGDPPLAGGVAMPVVSEGIVIPVCSRMGSFGANGGGVAVFRHPADTMNWVTTDHIDRESALACFMGEMEAIQYTLLAREDGASGPPTLFAKGMLGVIPDALWPRAWEGQSMVVCHKDIKASAHWFGKTSSEMEKECPVPIDRSLWGALTICQWLAPGNCVGVPYSLQSTLAGDYDGDQAVLLEESQLPETYAYIHKMCSSRPKNPKLEKTLRLLTPDDSRIACIEKIHAGASLVGTWTNVSSHLLRLPPEKLARFADDQHFEGPEALLQRVSLGIKQGTDAFKTRVDIHESSTLAALLLDAIEREQLLAPYVRWKKHPEVEWEREDAPYGLVSRLYWRLAERHGASALSPVTAANEFVVRAEEEKSLPSDDDIANGLRRIIAIVQSWDSQGRQRELRALLGQWHGDEGQHRAGLARRTWNVFHIRIELEPTGQMPKEMQERTLAVFGDFVTDYWDVLEAQLPRG